MTRGETEEVLRNAAYGRIGVAENNQPCIIPMNYEWKRDGCYYCFLIYGFDEFDSNLEAIRNNNKVMLEIEISDENSIRVVYVCGKAKRFIDMGYDRDFDGDGLAVEVKASLSDVTGTEYYCNCCCEC